jgi:hypothetical protein
MFKMNEEQDPFFRLEVEKDEDADLIPFHFRNYLSNSQRNKVHSIDIIATQDMNGGYFQTRCFGQILKSKS